MRSKNNYESTKGNTNVKNSMSESDGGGWSNYEPYEDESNYVASGEKANSREAQDRIRAWKLGRKAWMLARANTRMF